jgi:hypothetical protein
MTLHAPLDLADFYSRPYHKEGGRALVSTLSEMLGEPEGEPASRKMETHG